MNRITRHPILSPPQDRREVDFLFNGDVMRAFEGETVSTALFANGVKEFSVHEKGDAPRGLFCANGQCSQCTVIVDGYPEKSCVTPLREGMDVRTLWHLPELPPDDRPLGRHGSRVRSCDVLVVGGGPSGLTATQELAKRGLHVLLVDDKPELGGKLVLQTHKFFGSVDDCFAGTRGIHIARKLEDQLRALPGLEILVNATVVGIYKDQRAGIFVDGDHYEIVDFKGMVVSAGARERSLVFPGNDLPGVYGAGAFQTLVNRDLVKAADRVFIVGSGNVGLIGAYHALQAGIQAVGIVDILDRVSGYKVHADKIRRMGVPIHLGHTVLCCEGDRKVERVTIARVDERYQPLLQTARTYAVDTLLIAVGLAPVDEFYDVASKFGFPVVKAGDAEEIAEASSAMFGGRLAGFRMARLLGQDVDEDPTWAAKAEVLRSRPGAIRPRPAPTLTMDFQPVFFCDQEIPCNPCSTVCPAKAIALEDNVGNIMDVPALVGTCSGCRLCVAICPGLAITLARKLPGDAAEVVLPHEFVPSFDVGDSILVTDQDGVVLEDAKVLRLNQNRKYQTWTVHVRVSHENATRVAGIRVQDPAVTEPLAEATFDYFPDEGIVCRCERVTVKELVDHIRTHDVTDTNQLKQVRATMGACGAKTCSTLLPRVFAMAGVDWKKVSPGTKRPLAVEVPMYALINEEGEDSDA